MPDFLQIVDFPESVADKMFNSCTTGLHFVGYSDITAPDGLLEGFNFDETCLPIVDIGQIRHILKPKAIEHEFATGAWEVFEEPDINVALMSEVYDAIRPAFAALGADDMRIKAANVNLCFPQFSDQPSSMIPHRDTIVKEDFYNFIWYLDDAGGDLHLYDVADDCRTQLRMSIPHKKGRMVIFSSDVFHAGTHAEKKLRVSLNANIVSSQLGKQ
jgi:hypothetical protein